jgi:LmbE family N-acetylglucosaminyl deacetylase
VATIVFFHAHPDDESLFTGGTMARAADEGHRVVLVTATRGERGHDHGGVLAAGESLVERRTAELAEACRVLGVARAEWLGYRDSGAGEASEQAKDSFSRADLAEAAGRLAAILGDESADALTIYDERGGYGHPDHVQSHRVGRLAARLAKTPSLYQSTFDQDHLRHLLGMAHGLGLSIDGPTRSWVEQLGVPGDRINTAVDVTKWLDRKRQAMAAHASQMPASSLFMTLPDLAFQLLFGTECYIDPEAVDGRRPWLF